MPDAPRSVKLLLAGKSGDASQAASPETKENSK